MQKVYETERLVLKVLDKSYAQLVLDYYLRNKSFLEPWEPLRSKEFYTKQYQEEQLKMNFLILMIKGLSGYGFSRRKTAVK